MERVLITGANKGIGLAIAEQILRQRADSFVFLGSRDVRRGEAARESLLAGEPSWNERLMLIEIDVSSEDSVEAAARGILGACGGEKTPLYGIVNNAGVGFGGRDLAPVLEVNTYGIERVCRHMAPLLDQERGRIVNITSAAGPNFVSDCSEERQAFFLDSTHTWSELDAFMKMCIELGGDKGAFATKGLGDGSPYGLSKACANTYTLMLARENPTLRINACTPGFIETDLTRHYAEAASKSPADMGMKPPAEGTVSAMHLLFGDVRSSGHYYGSDALRSPLDRYRAPGTPAYDGS